MTIDTNNKPEEFLAQAKDCLKQLGEAHDLLDDLFWRLAWALDFSAHERISEALEPVLDVVSNAQDMIDSEQNDLQTQIEEYEFDLAQAETEVQSQHKFLLDV
jgi:flagellar capping protein FliD